MGDIVKHREEMEKVGEVVGVHGDLVVVYIDDKPRPSHAIEWVLVDEVLSYL